VLLINQRDRNEKLGLEDFNKFPLPEPPLYEDPFASVSAADLASTEVAPADDDDSDYEDDVEAGEDDEDDDE
jgi:hypothetical protein